MRWFYDWNSAANWTKAPVPNEKKPEAAIAAMIKMLDETPFVERYSLYNWVEDGRRVYRDKEDSLTPAGEACRGPTFKARLKSSGSGRFPRKTRA